MPLTLAFTLTVLSFKAFILLAKISTWSAPLAVTVKVTSLSFATLSISSSACLVFAPTSKLTLPSSIRFLISSILSSASSLPFKPIAICCSAGNSASWDAKPSTFCCASVVSAPVNFNIFNSFTACWYSWHLINAACKLLSTCDTSKDMNLGCCNWTNCSAAFCNCAFK